MASSSSSTINIPPRKYHVFLSFRGEDTRNNFTGHLYKALLRNQIETFIDSQLIRGDEISQSLLSAIEESTISIIVFSEQYASSGWCLDELVKILECKNMYGQLVIPIFYHVDPSHVRNQVGNFGNSFLKLEERLKERMEKLRKWRVALKEAANLSGFDSSVIRCESELIEKIVKYILKKLKDMFPSDFTKDLVGVESRIEEIESLLSHGAMGIYTLGIWGLGGIGKTTIARAFFNKISSQFDGSCFISNIREELEKVGGLTQLRRELFLTLLGDGNFNVGFSSFNFNFEIKRLNHKKVLVAFDDVTYFDQIKSLIGSFDGFMPGSLIIVTTRDKSVLKICEVKIIYEMKKFADVDALKLFSWHAFRQSNPNASYEKLSSKLIQYAQGVPLVLKVLGCFLYRRSRREWESEIKKLQTIPLNEIQKVLKVSYDGLDDTTQNFFLDIACFFKGENKDFIVKFLDASGLFAEIGISVLVDRSLIVISNDNTITMHDLLQKMGREIVRQESVDYPENRSRLWYHKDVYEVLTSNTGTQAIQGISLNMNTVEEINLNLDTFKQMRNLRFLKFYGENKFKISGFGSEGYIFRKLRYFQWDRYPLKLVPSNFHTENLVFLKLPFSNVEQLWDGVQNLVNLKEIDLSHSKQLMKLPNLSKAQNIEKLILSGCSSLVEIHSTIQHLNKLVILDLSWCKSLSNFKRFLEVLSCNLEGLYLTGTTIEELPSSIDYSLSNLVSLDLGYCTSLKSIPSNLFNLKSLRFLSLSNCSNLKSFPEISSCDLKQLHLEGTAIEELPSSIEFLSRLVTLDLRRCLLLNSLPSSLCKLKSLAYLCLTGCSNLQRLPEEINNLDALKVLTIERTAIIELPSSIECLKNLVQLSLERFRGHKQMGFILPPSVSFDGWHNLKSLTLIDNDITELPKSLFKLSSLEKLFLDKNKFERLPKSIINLSKLRFLTLSHCKKLQSLPNLPISLQYINANHCSSLEALSGLSILFNIGQYWHDFRFTNCFKLDQNELKKIVNNTQLLSTAELNKGCHPYLVHHICYPGSEIPKYFKFQSMGSSLTLKMPSVFQFNSELVGFACCVIVSFGEHHKSQNQHFLVICELKVKTKSVECLHIATIDSVKAKHVIFGYRMFKEDPCDFLENNEAFLEFYLTDMLGKRIECCEMVNKCGIHLL